MVLLAVVFASKSASPGQELSPVLKFNEVLGPGAKLTSPDIKTIPVVKGKSEPLASKEAIPLSAPKSVPVR